MSAPMLRFYPYLRTGLARHITGSGADEMPAAGVIEASVEVAGSPVARTLSVRGPGHVVGIDRSEILRTEPGDGATAFEPNYFPYIELASADLPWRYTPAAPVRQSLRPWLVLVVVRRRAGVRLLSRPGGLLPVLEIGGDADAREELPSLARSASWACVQHTVDPQATGALASQFADQPERFVARLISPRDLAAGTSYIAALVPAFDAGRDAGLGASGHDPATLADAWTPDTRSVSLPVYHSWSFSTGPDGDFELLVRRLTPTALDPSTGYRPLDLSDPGSGIAPKRREVAFAGALVAPDSTGWWKPTRERSPFRATLREELERAVALEEAADDADVANDPVLGPPLYGAMATGVDRLGAAAPVWQEEINENPHWRTAAGLGAEVVRRNQEALVGGAWDQAGAQRQANTLVRHTRLASAVGERLTSRLARLSVGALVQLTHGAHSRVKLVAADPNSKTVRHDLVASTVPTGMVSAAFRRAARPQGTPARVGQRGVAGLTRQSAGRFTRQAIAGSIGFEGLQVLQVPAGTIFDSEACYGLAPEEVDDSGNGGGAARTATRARSTITPGLQAPTAYSASQTGTVKAATLDDLPRVRLDQNAALVTDRAAAAEAARPDTAARTLANAAATIVAALQPAAVLQRRVTSRIAGLTAVTDHAVLPDRTWFDPAFDEPLYEELLALGTEYFCPGIGAVADDVVGLLEVNAEFVTSFLVGANHELVGELVWREFPCRPEATFFKQFWNTGRGGLPDIDDLENRMTGNPPKRDQRTLGALAAAPGGGGLVLLVRGELLRRYPDLVVYAVEARKGPRNTRQPDDSKAHEPRFTGTVDRSTRFWGFDATAPEARGDDGGDGWFFVIEQQPTAPRFGLDERTGQGRTPVPESTDEWSWDHVTGEVYADLGARPFRGMSSAQIAQATYQRPVRFYAHATTMLPE